MQEQQWWKEMGYAWGLKKENTALNSTLQRGDGRCRFLWYVLQVLVWKSCVLVWKSCVWGHKSCPRSPHDTCCKHEQLPSSARAVSLNCCPSINLVICFSSELDMHGAVFQTYRSWLSGGKAGQALGWMMGDGGWALSTVRGGKAPIASKWRA